MTTNLLTDKIVLYFIATITAIAILIGTHFLYTLIQIQNEHKIMDIQENQDVAAINNITKHIVDNQHLILQNQKAIKDILNILNSNTTTKTTTP